MDSATETMQLPERLPNSLKRSYDAMASPKSPQKPIPSVSITLPSTELSPESDPSSSRGSMTQPHSRSRQASPALSAASTSLTSMSATPPPPTYGLDGTTQAAGAGDQPPAKRRKLTFAEKEQRKKDKEERDNEKAAQRENKDAEKAELKAKRDEEKRLKNELLEEKRREKDLEKLKKDEEKRKVEEERGKKERAQSRIFSFFGKPQTPAKSKSEPGVSASTGSPLKLRGADDNLAKSPSATESSDYLKTFLPFALPSNAQIAPPNVHVWDNAATEHMAKRIAQGWAIHQTINESRQDHIITSLDLRRSRPPHICLNLPTVRELMEDMNGRSSDLTGQSATEDPIETLRRIPVRYLEFKEDVRPPYVGTYTKPQTRRLARNPFARKRQDTDYDYDSEAEWEEPEEGEDLDSEGESEGGDSVEAGDEMDGFLDDDGADGLPMRRKVTMVAADLEPKCSGLCFEDLNGDCHDGDGSEIDLSAFRLGLLLDDVQIPIDPFSTKYWPMEQGSASKPISEPLSTQTMTPPNQLPLQNKPNTAISGIVNVLSGSSVRSNKEKPTSAVRLLSGPELDAFKAAVNGSEHNKTVLVGLLKKRFPKVAKAVLSDTLSAVATRVGRTETDKKWIIT